MRNNYSCFSIVRLMDQIWQVCGRNFLPYWNAQHSLNVLEKLMFFIGLRLDILKIPSQARERGLIAAWLPILLIQKTLALSDPSDTWQMAIFHLSARSALAEPFPYRGRFLLLCVGGKYLEANETGKTVPLARKTLFFPQLILFVSFKTISSWDTKGRMNN